jgi:hypothetical protein
MEHRRVSADETTKIYHWQASPYLALSNHVVWDATYFLFCDMDCYLYCRVT